MRDLHIKLLVSDQDQAGTAWAVFNSFFLKFKSLRGTAWESPRLPVLSCNCHYNWRGPARSWLFLLRIEGRRGLLQLLSPTALMWELGLQPAVLEWGWGRRLRFFRTPSG